MYCVAVRSGRTAQAARNISCSRTASARCTTGSSRGRVADLPHRREASTGTKTKITPSSSCWRLTASTICTTARTGRHRRPVSRQFEECGPHQRVEPEREIVRRPGHVRDGREPERDRDDHEGSTRCPLRRRITAGADLDPLIPHWNRGRFLQEATRAEEGARRKNRQRQRLPAVGCGGSGLSVSVVQMTRTGHQPAPTGGIAGVNDTVQIVENWSRILGRVKNWEPPQQIRRAGHLDIAVERVEDVASADGCVTTISWPAPQVLRST